MVGILPEEIRTNWRNRGIQSADWVERLLPDWDKTKNQVKEALMDNEVKKYVDNPDYDSSKRPNGFVESIDKKSTDEPTLLETEDSAINGEAKK